MGNSHSPEQAIQMVDLVRQHEKIRGEIDSAIDEVIRSAAFINGPAVGSFENALASYLDVPHVIACASGTDALQIALMALGIRPGDEVITPSFTFISTVEVIALLGLTPVLVDVDPHTFNIDPEATEKVITKKTRAIIPVHLYGQCADMQAIMDIAKRHKLLVIEDAAQALGAGYRFNDGKVLKAGTMGTIGCTSFFPSKCLGCLGDGGALFTSDPDLAQKIRVIANHGSKVKYYHEFTGINSRLDTIQAAVLQVKLKYLDGYIRSRQAVAAFYDKSFRNIQTLIIPHHNPRSTHIFHQYTLRTNGIDRDEMQKNLRSKGIPTMVYYPVPLHLQKAFSGFASYGCSLPVSEEISRIVLSLPMHTELDEKQLEFITTSVGEFAGR